MDFNSPIYDRIRIKPVCDEVSRKDTQPACQHPGCTEPGLHRAPKGRGHEGQYWRFCVAHVREYNASYNYFAGMSDAAVQAYQKEAAIGHRPTWSMGVQRNGKARNGNGDWTPAGDWQYFDPLNVMSGDRFRRARPARPAEPRKPVLSAPVRRALDVLGLDETASGVAIKAQYKLLVKRFHPDAHGGDRSFEERLRDIIRAHDILKTAGMC